MVFRYQSLTLCLQKFGTWGPKVERGRGTTGWHRAWVDIVAERLYKKDFTTTVARTEAVVWPPPPPPTFGENPHFEKFGPNQPVLDTWCFLLLLWLRALRGFSNFTLLQFIKFFVQSCDGCTHLAFAMGPHTLGLSTLLERASTSRTSSFQKKYLFFPSKEKGKQGKNERKKEGEKTILRLHVHGTISSRRFVVPEHCQGAFPACLGCSYLFFLCPGRIALLLVA